MTQEIDLVSCVKAKQDEPAMPKRLHLLLREYALHAEQYHDNWWILSAKHGLLNPDGDLIEPYDEILSGAKAATKREWAEGVLTS